MPTPTLAGVLAEVYRAGDEAFAGSATTDVNGYWEVGGLAPDTYYVIFTPPTGYSFTPVNQGSDDRLDSDADPAAGRTGNYAIASGELNPTVDAGLVATAGLGNFVWHDLNADGHQDLGEPGVAGVTVTLIGGGGDGLVSTSGDNTMAAATTDGEGLYSFNGLLPGVEYQVVFSLASGYVSFTPAGAGGDNAVDSDANPATGEGPVVVLAPGAFNARIDAGQLQASAIGDRVWMDLNGDGIQDAEEGGLAGVMVALTGSSVLGQPVSLTTGTNADGLYQFGGLVPGTYTVTVSNPGGYIFSPRDRGGDDTLDSDVDGSGVAAPVTVGSGQTNLTVDGGLVQETTIIVLGPDKNPGTPQAVRVVNRKTGVVESSFVAYELNYVGGTRVAIADLDGDGIDEIITAPGRNHVSEVRIFTLQGDPVPGFPSFLAYGAEFTGGVQLTVGYINDDDLPDLITVPSYGAAEVRIFLNGYDKADATHSAPALSADRYLSFKAFPVASIGGAVVAAGDMGRLAGGSFINDPDGLAEIVVGTGGGHRGHGRRV